MKKVKTEPTAKEGYEQGIYTDALPPPARLLSAEYYAPPVQDSRIIADHEAGHIDTNLLAIREQFPKEVLPMAWDVSLGWKTGGPRKRVNQVHPLAHNGGEAENYDPEHNRDDDDVWERLAHDGRGSAGGGGGKGKKDEDETIDFPRGNTNQFARVTMDDLTDDSQFMPSLPPPAPDAPFMDIPELDGVTIPTSVDDIPVPLPWRQVSISSMPKGCKKATDLIQEDRMPESGAMVNIKKMNMSLIRPDYTIVCYGKRRTGKTNFVRYFMKCFRCFFPEVYVFTKTKVDKEYYRFVPDKFIFNGYKDKVIQHILDRQEDRQRKLRKRGVNDENINVLIILDDCIDDNVLKYSETIKTIFFNGRHLYMSIVINSQDHKAIGPGLRSNTDMVATFPVRSQRDKEAVRENYADFVKNDNEFETVAQAIRETPYTIMFIDQSRPYMDPEECVYAGIAPLEVDLGGFFMGSREHWRGSEAQAIELGGANWIAIEDWGIVAETYHFAMGGLPEGVTMELPTASHTRHQKKKKKENVPDSESSDEE